MVSVINVDIVVFCVTQCFLIHDLFLFLGEVLSEDAQGADGSQAEQQQQQGAHPLSAFKTFCSKI